MRYIFLCVLLFSFSILFGQSGNYFLSHFSPKAQQSSGVCFDIVQNGQGLLYFATQNGILEFDGYNWDLISGEGSTYSLAQSDEGIIYWAGVNGYGKIQVKGTGEKELLKLSEKGIVNVFQSLTVKEKLYFITPTAIVIEQSGREPLVIKATPLTGTFTNAFELFENFYINTELGGIFRLDNHDLVRSTFSFPQGVDVLFAKRSADKYVIGLSNNTVYTCGKDITPQQIILEDQLYLDASILVNGNWINPYQFALGTLRGGMIFVQASNGTTEEIVNYNTGLPDNEIFALMSDKSQCVWAAHEYGFTRIAPHLPFRSFSHFNGIEGNLICARSFKDAVYVGTSLGLYKLEKEEIYDEIVYYVQREVNDKKASAKPVVNDSPAQDNTIKEEEPKKRGFLGFLKKGKKPTESVLAEERPTAQQKQGLSPNPSTKSNLKKYKKVKQTLRVLQTSRYVYKKVQQINSKVTELIELNGKLVAIGIQGAFEITDLTASAILEEPVRTGYGSTNLNSILLATYADEVRVFKSIDNQWQSQQFLENLDEPINYMMDGEDNELWLFALNKAYRLDVNGNEVKNIQSVDINNPSFDAIVCVKTADKILLANTQGFFQYDRQSNSFTQVDPLVKPTAYFVSQDAIIFNDARKWNMLGSYQHSNLKLLNLLRDIRFISATHGRDNVWIITGNNELYKFYGEKFMPTEVTFPLVLRSLRNGNERKDPSDFEVDQEKSSLTFKVTQPDFLAPQSIEYRFKLEGLDGVWSDWMTNQGLFDFPYLPSGNYSLLVEARDIFGKISAISPVEFEVLPPYWKRPWFYALEFLVFASLVILSFRLSTRYRIISRLLSLLTIIMLIQFIQTVVSETFETRASPVIDFFMQVFVAFLILPVEGYLRNLMLRSLNSESSLYRFLTPKPHIDASDK